MKSFFVLCFCLVFLPAIIHGSGSDDEENENGNEFEDDRIEILIEKLNEMAENEENINEILQLARDGNLGQGSSRVVYKGVRMSDSRPVAIKFFERHVQDSAEREYRIYSYLDAIDNANVERFGIPAIYYYGPWTDWRNYIVMALSFCEESLFNKANEAELQKPLNSLIVFRQFVRQSKYLHSRGVRHDDIKIENIMIRNYQCLLIDYDISSQMKKDTKICTIAFKPRRCHRNRTRFAIDDWESFFYTMCYVNDVQLKWLFDNEYDDLDDEIGEAKKDTKDILQKVNAIKSEPLKEAFIAIYNEIFCKKWKKFPDYNGIDHIITAQIERMVPPNEPAFFTWMNESDTEAALKHMEEYPVPDIHNDIQEPSKVIYKTFKYPKVDFGYFYKTSAESSVSLFGSSSSNLNSNKK